MAVMVSNNKNDLAIDCHCGCENGFRLSIDKDTDSDFYCLISYYKGNWYSEQNHSLRRILFEKFKKIWSIIRNKDYNILFFRIYGNRCCYICI